MAANVCIPNECISRLVITTTLNYNLREWTILTSK